MLFIMKLYIKHLNIIYFMTFFYKKKKKKKIYLKKNIKNFK